MINQNAFVLIFTGMFVVGCVGGYFLGRYQSNLANRIRTLVEQSREKKPEPEKPAIIGGAYQPPKPIGNAADKKLAAGIIETKTPQQLDWEAQEELRKLEHSS